MYPGNTDIPFYAIISQRTCYGGVFKDNSGIIFSSSPYKKYIQCGVWMCVCVCVCGGGGGV